jgi:hypothetical protein
MDGNPRGFRQSTWPCVDFQPRPLAALLIGAITNPSAAAAALPRKGASLTGAISRRSSWETEHEQQADLDECGEDLDGGCECAYEREPACADGHDHEWTGEGTGGCRENPGVWSRGGTTIVQVRRCKHCDVTRMSVSYGSQRNPGQHDTLKYETPEWQPPVDDGEVA